MDSPVVKMGGVQASWLALTAVYDRGIMSLRNVALCWPRFVPFQPHHWARLPAWQNDAVTEWCT